MVYRHCELIAQHRLDYSKNSTNVNPAHYKELMIKQSFNTKNTIFDEIDVLHTYIPQIDLNAYDLEGH